MNLALLGVLDGANQGHLAALARVKACGYMHAADDRKGVMNRAQITKDLHHWKLVQLVRARDGNMLKHDRLILTPAGEEALCILQRRWVAGLVECCE